MKRLKIKDILLPVIALVLISGIVTALLAFTNSVTEEPINKNSQKNAEEARARLISTADSFNSVDDYYCALAADGSTIGYIFESAAKGYGGDISIMVGITVDGNVSGVEILSHGETPGLGANATKSSFTDEYKQAIPAEFSVVKDGTGGSDGKIDALTGATITSKAVTTAVNTAVEKYKSVTGGQAE